MTSRPSRSRRRVSGQPEIAWQAQILDRAWLSVLSAWTVTSRSAWSHGRFQGSPEAKIYLDTQHSAVPGFYALVLADALCSAWLRPREPTAD